MTDELRVILHELTAGTLSVSETETLDGLFAWARAQGLLLRLELRDTSCTAGVMRRQGKIRRHLGWGEGATGYEAVGRAIVSAFAYERICQTCYGDGVRWDDQPCPGCGGSGVKTTTDEEER